LEIGRCKWRWLAHTLLKSDEAVEKKALELNPQGTRKRGRPCDTLRRIVEESLDIWEVLGLTHGP
jgi:hypothetical protein